MNLTLAVGIMGTLTGLVAGWAGTYLAIASATGPRERAFMGRAAVVCWTAVAGLVMMRFVVPELWLPAVVAGMIVLPYGLRRWQQRQVEIRDEERTSRPRSSEMNRKAGRMREL